MNSEIANILKAKVDGLPFVDRIAGLVTTLTISEETEAGKKRKTFPVACNVSQADCMAGRYQDLVPDTAKKSVLYFEESGGAQMTGMEGNKMKFRSNLRLVGWLNLKKMGLTDCGWSSTAVLQIIRELSDFIQPSNHGNKFIHFKVTAISQAEKTSAIFSKYTYDEAVTQYLIYPYDYFAVNIAFEFSINKNCIQDAEIPDIEICDENTGEVENPTPTVGECWDLLRWNCDTNMWVRWHAPTTPGVYNITVNEDGSLTFTEDTGGGGGGTLTCENIDECETIQNIVQSVDDVTDDLAQEILARDAGDDALQDAIDETQADIDTHEARTDNPHSVTKTQVGLGNVDNTSDANKPVSTATQTALNNKQDALGYTPENIANKTDVMAGNTASSTKYLSAKGVYDYIVSLAYLTVAAAASTYQAIITSATWGAFINGLTGKTTPADADMIGLMDSADSNNAKKMSVANLKASLYAFLGSKLIFNDHTSYSLTGTNSETLMLSVPIPAGTMSNAKSLEIYWRVIRSSGATGNITPRIRISTTASPSPVTGATQLALGIVMSTNNNWQQLKRTLLYKSATSTTMASTTGQTVTDDVNQTAAQTSVNIDWTVTQYLLFTLQNSATGDVSSLESVDIYVTG